ncbi:hypothetical protein NBT05_12160 [Aquimarina sp. ERC-38]|uniref:hypothetical protein n=1 Tax=Aquimarina sp. ERC-38 TaxID=2949996 RepID=UPI002245888A|nr:hypothetical protein [Aquimarina sp. ERC-38]UZO79704.1 hypothetical protein NBT05_12160 [Aquimarina sp. ERC-38]
MKYKETTTLKRRLKTIKSTVGASLGLLSVMIPTSLYILVLKKNVALSISLFVVAACLGLSIYFTKKEGKKIKQELTTRNE